MPNCNSRKRWLQRRVKKNLFADLLATDVVQEIETLLGRQAVEDLDLEALELAVRQQVLQLAGAAVEQRLNADTSDARGSRTRCGCGQEARLVGRRSKQVHSVLGPLRLERAYYHCASCGHGYCPRDEHLGIENTSLSPALTRMVGTVGAMVSFQEGSELLTELAGVAVDAKQVERTAEALGEEIAEDERHCTEPCDVLALPRTLYLGMDGTGIPLRAEELVGRTGKQPDRSAKTGEVKLCTIWSAESLDEEGTPIRDEGSVTYSAALESASALDTAVERSPFAQRVWREATRRLFCQAPRRVVLGDGAVWIWNIADDQFPGATQIVDRYHAKEYLSDLGKALYGPTAHGLLNGQNAARKNSIPENSWLCSTPSAARSLAPIWLVAVSIISRPTASVCAIRSSTPKACARPPALSRPDARWPSARASNVPGCTGPFAAPTPSLLSAAQNSVVVFKTSGSADQNAGPHDPSLSWGAPSPSDSRSLHGMTG